MLNASQNYIISDLNCNKYIQDKVCVNNHNINQGSIPPFTNPEKDFTIIVIIVKFIYWFPL